MSFALWFGLGVVLILIFVFVEIMSKKQNIEVKLAVVFFLLVLFSVVYVYLRTGSSIGTAETAWKFTQTYFSWLGSVFDNVKGLTADAISKDWSVVKANATAG